MAEQGPGGASEPLNLTTKSVYIPLRLMLQATEAAEADLEAAREAQERLDKESDRRLAEGFAALHEKGFVYRCTAAHDHRVTMHLPSCMSRQIAHQRTQQRNQGADSHSVRPADVRCLNGSCIASKWRVQHPVWLQLTGFAESTTVRAQGGSCNAAAHLHLWFSRLQPTVHNIARSDALCWERCAAGTAAQTLNPELLSCWRPTLGTTSAAPSPSGVSRGAREAAGLTAHRLCAAESGAAEAGSPVSGGRRARRCDGRPEPGARAPGGSPGVSLVQFVASSKIPAVRAVSCLEFLHGTFTQYRTVSNGCGVSGATASQYTPVRVKFWLGGI